MRIHFTGVDLVRTRLASGLDPMWETVLSLQMLRARYGRGAYGDWRRQARTAVRAAGHGRLLREVLFPLTPDATYFPDFLTPPEGLLGLRAGIEAMRATPRRRLRAEVARVELPERLMPWARRLADADREVLADLGAGIAAYHRVVLAADRERMAGYAEADLARRARLLRTAGTEGLLAGFMPMMRWRPPVLEIPKPMDRDLYLGGRGLVLVPSCFCWLNPIPLADPTLPPTLIYPLRPVPAEGAAAEPAAALRRLIGGTRARVLEAAADGATTTELARRLGLSAAGVSAHTRVLREAGLIVSVRDANAVIHTRTPLGDALLTGVEGD
nr:winged helix-turn-helix domain-containing protein [Streptomyces coryli]